MTYIGTVSKGKVTLPPDAKLPDGTKVRVETVETPSAIASNGQQLRETLLKYAGKAQGLPPRRRPQP